jgi:hypothetical protein
MSSEYDIFTNTQPYPEDLGLSEPSYPADSTVDGSGKRLRWQCGCRQNGGTQVIQWRAGDPDIDAIVTAAVAVLRASHIGDQNFIPCLNGDDAASLRLALVALGDVFRQG